jgi:DNA-binding GntR family transcriptional regulator
LCEVFLDGMPHASMDSPYFRVFMHRNAGIQIMHTLLAASAGDVFPPQQPIALSLSAAARRFKVSRIHVRRLLDAGERDGLLRLSADGAVQFEPAGRDAIDYIFATQLIRFLSAAARTLALKADLAEAMARTAEHHAPTRIERDRDQPAHFG